MSASVQIRVHQWPKYSLLNSLTSTQRQTAHTVYFNHTYRKNWYNTRMKRMLLIILTWTLCEAIGIDCRAMESTRNPKAIKTPAAALIVREEQLIQQFLRDFPESEQVLIEVGDYYEQQGKTELALSYWQQAVQKDPNGTDAYARMAKLAFDSEDYEESVRLWQRAVQINPTIPNFSINLTRALMQVGRYPEALIAIQQGLKQSGDTVLAYLLLGAIQLELKQYEKAKRSYEKALEFDTESQFAYYGLYQVCTRLKEHPEAAKFLSEFQQRKARWRETKQKTVVQYLSHGKRASAFHADCLAKLCRAAYQHYQARSLDQAAEDLLKQAIRLAPDNIAYRTQLMAFYKAADRKAEALQVCQAICRLDPNNSAGQLDLGRLASQINQFTVAEAAFREAMRLAPHNSAGYAELALLYVRIEKNYPEARALAVKAVQLKPKASHFFLLGWLWHLTGHPDKAIASLKQAIALDPKNPHYALVLAQVMKGKERQ